MDVRYRPFSRREFNSGYAAWLRRNRFPVAVTVIGSVVLLTLVTFLLLGIGGRGPSSWYLLGLMHGAVIAAVVSVLRTAYLAHDRKAIWHVRGAWGEENTRDELRRAKWRRLIWGWVDSIDLQFGDIDHLVVTRRGGVVAIDSKWRNDIDASDNIAMARSAGRARLRAEALSRTVLGNVTRARHRAREHPVHVRSVVVIWGSAQGEVPVGACIDGTDFVAGRRLVEWLDSLAGEPITKAAASELIKKLVNYRAAAQQKLPATSDHEREAELRGEVPRAQ